MERRKDNKGRVLHTGECQRKDGTYTYKYKNLCGVWKTISATTLKHLREREAEIAREQTTGVNYSSKKITVIDAVKLHLELQRQTVRASSMGTYNTSLSLLEREDFAYRDVKKIVTTDVRRWCGTLKDRGYSFATVKNVKSLVSSAVNRLIEDRTMSFNPFAFDLNTAIKDDTLGREALTPRQQEQLLSFLLSYQIGLKYYDEIVVLLGTGVRASEFCGLTIRDIDFAERCIHVDHQLKKEHGIYTVEEPKTECAKRDIPMTDGVYNSLLRIVAQRKKQPVIFPVGEHSQFLFLTTWNTPKTSHTIRDDLNRIVERYNKQYPNDPLPKITPHILRHTFCTNMARANVAQAAVQYMMGHASYKTTADVYTHPDLEFAMQEIKKLQA